jgi:3-hydroxyacyl-CoA dehydrogenase/enoyl-CoA hydratase/3-hydroxybutyryl-CoA epimerase/3-hydroxyacyl-CoA dehydrogenase/enoyl-CoA hydratase/3-hydroxybutyryl-CoA epimerase/enoyl-CoA isomerase
MPALPPNPAGPFRTLTLERRDDGVVVMSFFVPDHAQNVLTAEAVKDLSQALDSIEAGPPPAAIVIRSSREGSFFAGADVARLERLHDMPPEEIERLCVAGRGVFSRLSSQACPSVAIIDGICLGGGLELALACDLRVATDSPHTTIGCPEVKLGLLPGWGGTVLLARLIGPAAAVELAAAGENVDGPTAARLGLVDACVPADQAIVSACRLAEVVTAQQSHIERRRQLAEPAPLVADEQDFLEAMSAAVILGRSGGHYPAPLAILETILAGCGTTAHEAGRLEAAAFARLAKSDVSRQLVRVFRLGERNRRDKGLDEGSTGATQGDAVTGHPSTDRVMPSEPAPRNRPAVIGAGIMGAGIAASHLRAGFAVTLIDVQADTLAASVAGILDEAAWDRGTKRTDPARAVALSGRLHTATRMAAIAECDLVIESVLERADIKRQVLVDIERTVGPTTVIATNTSTNPIAKLAEPLQDPTRFCGIHFFNPVRRMTLVEVIRGPATSDETVATAVAHVKRLGKCPIVVRDSPGFLVNRVLMPYLHESVEMLREGIEAKRIDRIARGFGMPMGPLELYDMIGLDTAFYAGLVLSAAYGDRIEASPLIPALVKSGRLGRKTGSGFYQYQSGGQRARIERPDEGVAKLVRPYALPARETTDATICDRLLLPMLLEALRVLDEGIVRDGRDIDLAVIHALGFPAFRGGLLAWGNSLGAAEVIRRLTPLADLGIRMHPTPRLLAMAAAGEPFTV